MCCQVGECFSNAVHVWSSSGRCFFICMCFGTFVFLYLHYFWKCSVFFIVSHGSILIILKKSDLNAGANHKAPVTLSRNWHQMDTRIWNCEFRTKMAPKLVNSRSKYDAYRRPHDSTRTTHENMVVDFTEDLECIQTQRKSLCLFGGC